jgi:hypothetical protein
MDNGEPVCAPLGAASTEFVPAGYPSMGICPPSVGGAMPAGGARTGAASTPELPALVSGGGGMGGGAIGVGAGAGAITSGDVF